MKTSKTNCVGTYRSGESGAALLIALCVAAILLVASLSMVFMSGTASIKSRKIADGAGALAIAEAGVADMLVKLSTNYMYWANNSHSASFGVGTFKVTTMIDSNSGNVVINSIGTVGSDSRATSMELLGNETLRNNALMASGGAIMTDGQVTLAHSQGWVNGAVKADGNVSVARGTVDGSVESAGNISLDFSTVNGDLSAGGTVAIAPQATLNGASSASVVPAPEVTLPTFDFEAYRLAAIANGLYFEGDQVFAGLTVHQPNNGIVFVNGKVEYGNNSTVYGCIVATDTITIRNRLTQIQVVTNMPALLSKGDISLQNYNTYNGAIFAEGSVKSWNRRTFNGPIMAGAGGVQLEGHYTLDPQAGYPIWDPNQTSAPPPVIIGGWLK